jgi:NitT/TauT family transport system substrate-binding protein
MNRYRRLLMTAAPMLCALVAFASAAAEANDVPAHYRGDGGIVRLPANENSTQVWHLAAMRKYKLDKKYGFTLQLVPAATSQMTATAIQSGQAEIGIFQFLDIARMRKADIRIIGVGPFLQWGADHFVVPVDSKVKNIGDLKGKKIGLFSRTSLDWILDQAIARNVYKMDVERDLIVQEGAVGLIRGLIETGQLDGAHMYNNLTPAMVANGKVKVLHQMKELVDQLGLPAIPFLFYSAPEAYLASKPQNIRAFLAAYREAVAILNKEDDVWFEHGKSLQMTPESIILLRDEMRVDLWPTFRPTTEADMKKVFEFLLKEAGPVPLGGLTEYPEGFMTREYQ